MKADYIWEECFTSDDSDLCSLDGKSIGTVRPVGGSWVVLYGGKEIAFRPDKRSAQVALIRYHETLCSEASVQPKTTAPEAPNA